ncbi:Na+/H+ antiporter subunit E [Alphaproteobacteria bacterium]|nr:Na+/H+ antiporter subunit E [Alphaproteobacteria bacterium]
MNLKAIASSTALMFGLWLILSGHYTGLLITIGFVSSLSLSLIAHRMGVLDEEGLPLDILWRLPKVSLWLIWEILKSNVDVARVILRPSSAQPQLVRVKASQTSVAGLVTYANFITLTPGTVAVNVDEDQKEILVHSLTKAFGEGLSDPEMDARVSSLEAGGKP